MKRTNSLFRRFVRIHLMLVGLFVIVFLMVRNVENPQSGTETFAQSYYGIVLFFATVLIVFSGFSWFFFLQLEKRLIILQETMQLSGGYQTFAKPIPIDKERMDEIDQLANSFNWMIEQLRLSRSRELKEETIRKELIANLSHDLRTPLTIMRGQLVKLQKERLSSNGQELVTTIDSTITRVSKLTDDLLDYTLVTSGKYPFNALEVDIIRLVRSHIATWYSLFEENKFVFNFETSSEQTFLWQIDPDWLKRILDNLFQNILRYASDGKFAQVMVDVEKEQIIIVDHGPGMHASNDTKGAGIGLTLSIYMLERMNLTAKFDSNSNGTKIIISKGKIKPDLTKNNT